MCYFLEKDVNSLMFYFELRFLSFIFILVRVDSCNNLEIGSIDLPLKSKRVTNLEVSYYEAFSIPRSRLSGTVNVRDYVLRK